MRKASIALIVLLLISGCASQEKFGEAVRTVPIVQPIVATPAPIAKIAGPPEKITVTATPNTIRCGEKTTITVTVKDSVGQNVVDHTKIVLSATTKPPFRIGYFEQEQIFTLNGAAQAVYKASQLPSYVQITGFVGSRFGLTELQVIC